jgi:hypothetical protein
LDVTHRFDVVDIYAWLFQNHLIHDKVTVWTRMCVPIYSNSDNVTLQNYIVTLTSEVGTWFLDMTHHLEVVDICGQVILKSLIV